MFYVTRFHLIFQDTVFEMSKCSQMILAIMPMVTYLIFNVVYMAYMLSHDCPLTGVNLSLLITFSVILELFWDAILFVLFWWKLGQIATMACSLANKFTEELREYLKKLFRLFVVAQIATFLVYTPVIIPAAIPFLRMLMGVKVCVIATTMVLSFNFSKPVYNRICLCQK